MTFRMGKDKGLPALDRLRSPGGGSAAPSSPVPQGHVYRFCTAEGLWLHKDNSSQPWRDLSECEESKRGEKVSWGGVLSPRPSSGVSTVASGACLGSSRIPYYLLGPWHFPGP